MILNTHPYLCQGHLFQGHTTLFAEWHHKVAYTQFKDSKK
jgi:hypothetical protein